MLLSNRIPWQFAKDIESIDYQALRNSGIKGLFFDLDNTIIPYDIKIIPHPKVTFLKKLEKNFQVVILTNNSVNRIKEATQGQFNCVARAMKPFRKGIKEAFALTGLSAHEVVIIGDQLQSDIKLANYNAIKSILVNPLAPQSEGFATKFNRFFEDRYLSFVLKHYPHIFKHYFAKFKK